MLGSQGEEERKQLNELLRASRCRPVWIRVQSPSPLRIRAKGFQGETDTSLKYCRDIGNHVIVRVHPLVDTHQNQQMTLRENDWKRDHKRLIQRGLPVVLSHNSQTNTIKLVIKSLSSMRSLREP